MKYDLRAYKLAMALILFQLAIPVVSSISIHGPLTGMTLPEILIEGFTSLTTLFSLGLGLLGVGFMTKVLGLETPTGAVVFVGAFQISNLPLGATLERLVELGYLIRPIQIFISMGMSVIMIGAFIWLSSN